MNDERYGGEREERARRAAQFAALGDPTRLQIAEALVMTDLTPLELRDITGVPSNLLAHHLNVLEEAALISRHASAADRRRRYVRLEPSAVTGLLDTPILEASRVLFVCQQNSARSQLAVALWEQQSPIPAESAGVRPAERVHPEAVRVARRHGLDISGARPRSYDDVAQRPDLVISVCDVAREDDIQVGAATSLHWSVPDPVAASTSDAFEAAWRQIAGRVEAALPLVRPPAEREPNERG
jgi:protein-tyrosine-phosphatase/DNA-binding HxlR family transcriptional regulator